MHVGMSTFFQNLSGDYTDGQVYAHEIEMADMAEPLGFDSIWAAEHHFDEYTMCPNVAQFLTYMAGRTKRVGLGSMVMVLPWHDPIRLTEEVLMLDHVSNGRTILGVGRGLGRIEFEGFRINMGESRERFVEYAEAILNALETGHMPEPSVTINIEDAKWHCVKTGDLVELSTRWGRTVLRAEVSDQVRKGDLFASIHWTDSFASQAVIGELVNPACDPQSGQPELKHTPACLQPLNTFQTGYFLSTEKVDLTGFDYWARRRIDGGYFHSLATLSSAETGFSDLLATFDGWAWTRDVLSMSDAAAGVHRRALLQEGRLTACLAYGPRGRSPSPEWIIDLFGADHVDDVARVTLLSGCTVGVQPTGPIVCACLGVREPIIREAIRNQNAKTVEQVGLYTNAGTNCGTCRSEIAGLLKAEPAETSKEAVVECA